MDTESNMLIIVFIYNFVGLFNKGYFLVTPKHLRRNLELECLFTKNQLNLISILVCGLLHKNF